MTKKEAMDLLEAIQLELFRKTRNEQTPTEAIISSMVNKALTGYYLSRGKENRMIFDGLAFMGCSLLLGMLWAYFF